MHLFMGVKFKTMLESALNPSAQMLQVQANVVI